MANGDLAAGARNLWRLSRGELAGWAELEHDRLRLGRVLAQRADARAFFAGVASEWDRLRTELYGERFTAEAIAALLPADATVADLACGSGAVTALLAPAVGRVVAVDASPEMLRAARARTRGMANVELRRGDLTELPVESGSCDAALLLLALTHVEAPDRALAELARILAAGGRAVIVDLLRHDREAFRRQMGQVASGFEPADLTRRMTAAGLAGVRCRPLPPEPKAKGPALLLATGTKPNPQRPAPAPRRVRERKNR
jgi:ArsR family transcriptional regulator